MKGTIAMIFAIAATSVIQLSCGTNPSVNSVVAVFTAGDVKTSSQGGVLRPLKIQDILKKGDTLQTGEKSFATLQIGDESIIQIAEGSTVDMAALLEGSSREIVLSSGKVLCKVDKLVKGGEFKIKTPTMNAAVRGTVFSVSCDKTSSTVALKQGKVTLTTLKDGKEQILTEGKAADISESISERDISDSESIELKKVEIFTYENKAATLPKEDMENKVQKIAPEIEKIEKELKSSPMTMDTLRNKYGRIDVITLYNGKVYQGAILSRGSMWRIITTKGQVTIPGSQVKNTGSH